MSRGFVPPAPRKQAPSPARPDTPGKRVRVCVDLEPSQYRAFRLACVANGETMTDILRAAVDRAISQSPET